MNMPWKRDDKPEPVDPDAANIRDVIGRLPSPLTVLEERVATVEDMVEAVTRIAREFVAASSIDDIKARVAKLTYGEMKLVASGILGEGAKPEDVIGLADKFHAWSETKPAVAA